MKNDKCLILIAAQTKILKELSFLMLSTGLEELLEGHQMLCFVLYSGTKFFASS